MFNKIKAFGEINEVRDVKSSQGLFVFMANKKGKYRIRANYDTGNSFGVGPDHNIVITLTWDNLDIAKENLIRLKEHYNWYNTKDTGYFYNKEEETKAKEVVASGKLQDWYVSKEEYQYNNVCVYLLNDKREKVREYVGEYLGYFETLNYMLVELNVDENESTDTKVYFR